MDCGALPRNERRRPPLIHARPLGALGSGVRTSQFCRGVKGMTWRPITLRKLAITDGVLPDATVNFETGFNLIVGASDTGKTFIFDAIDFMLGARDPLRRIPEAAGYESVWL